MNCSPIGSTLPSLAKGLIPQKKAFPLCFNTFFCSIRRGYFVRAPPTSSDAMRVHRPLLIVRPAGRVREGWLRAPRSRSPRSALLCAGWRSSAFFLTLLSLYGASQGTKPTKVFEV